MQPDWSGRTKLLPGGQAASCHAPPPPFQWSHPVCGQLVLPPRALKVLLLVLGEKLKCHLFLSQCLRTPGWTPRAIPGTLLMVFLMPAVIRHWLIYCLSPGRKVFVYFFTITVLVPRAALGTQWAACRYCRMKTCLRMSLFTFPTWSFSRAGRLTWEQNKESRSR